MSKHSSATAVDIQVTNDSEGVAIIISDNGSGIAEDATSRLGLTGMRARVLALNGKIAFEPNDPAGTNVTVQIPHEIEAPYAN